MKSLNTTSRLIIVIALLATSVTWTAPVNAKIKHPLQGDERERPGSETNARSADDRVTSLKGSPDTEAPKSEVPAEWHGRVPLYREFSLDGRGVRRLQFNLPDIVLADIGLPGISGIEGKQILKGRHPQLLLLTLTVYEDDERIFDALCAGASGYLLKKTAPARLLEDLRETVHGGAPMSPEIARRVVELFREIRPPDRADYQLTPHETRILKMLVEGHNYKTAAAELAVTPSTINFHLRNIYEKLQVHSKTEAVVKALSNRLI